MVEFKKLKVSPSSVERSTLNLEKPNSVILGRTMDALSNQPREEREDREKVLMYSPKPIQHLLFGYNEIHRLWEMENPFGCSISEDLSTMVCGIS